MNWIRQLTMVRGVVLATCLTASLQAHGQIKIGIVLPFSGPNGSMSADARSVIERVFKQRGLDAELLYEDSAGAPARAYAAASKLIAKEKVDVIIGPFLVGQAFPLLELSTKFKRPFILLATMPEDVERRLPGDFPWVVAFNALPKEQIGLVLNTLRKSTGFLESKEIALVKFRGIDNILTSKISETAGQLAVNQASVSLKGAGPESLQQLQAVSANYGLIAGILPDLFATQMRDHWTRNKLKTPFIVFSPPPVRTLAFIAASILASSVKEVGQDAKRLLEHLKSAGRFRKATGTFAVPWTIRSANMPNVYYEGIVEMRSARVTADREDYTVECSCEGKPDECKECEDGKCSKTDGADCTTSCAD